MKQEVKFSNRSNKNNKIKREFMNNKFKKNSWLFNLFKEPVIILEKKKKKFYKKINKTIKILKKIQNIFLNKKNYKIHLKMIKKNKLFNN